MGMRHGARKARSFGRGTSRRYAEPIPRNVQPRCPELCPCHRQDEAQNSHAHPGQPCPCTLRIH